MLDVDPAAPTTRTAPFMLGPVITGRRAAALLAAFAVFCACGSSAAPIHRATSATSALGQTGSTGGTTVRPAGRPASTTIAPARSTPTTAAGNGCGLPPQSPPNGTVSANFATALDFAPDGRLFFTERSGTVRVVQNGHSQVFATVATVTTEPGGGYSERGLLGLAIDPAFARNRFVYAFYSDTNDTQQHVIRWKDCAGVGTQATVLITFPAGDDCCHKGGRLAFGPDGKLYVTLGDEHSSNGTVAQNPGDVRGKVLRYNADGGVPADNPFGAGDPVWVYGLRNPFGLAFSAGGQLAITNNGPSGEMAGGPATGYDTVIFAAGRGAHYQWPTCYGYGHPNPGYSACSGVGPDWSSEASTDVPTGATFVDGAGPAGYANRLVVCTYNSGMLVFTPGAPHGAVTTGPSTCRFDVKEGPNHAVYFSGADAIYRLG